MGTRNLTVVKYRNNYPIAQYGQWDGYPGGVGETIVSFLTKDPDNINKLKEKLPNVRFLDKDGKDKEFIENYSKNTPTWSNEPDNRTDEQKEWFRTFMTRDLGADILENVANSDLDEIILENDLGFGADSLYCEWAYVIDLDENLFYVYTGFQAKPHNKGIWADAELKEYAVDTTYYPCKPIVKFDLTKSNLRERWDTWLTTYNKKLEEE